MSRDTDNRAKGRHWASRMNHRNRTSAFLVGFAALALQLRDHPATPWLWVGLGFHFLIGPHLLDLRARRAARPFEAEVQHVLVDAAGFGLWSGLFGFPLWITFMFLIGATVNPAAFRGRAGLARGIGAYAIAALVGWAWAGFAVHAETSTSVTLLCIASVTFFMLTVALGAHDRSVQLHDARAVLQANERVLQSRLESIEALQAELNEQAVRDPLTGLYNRRHMVPTLERELVRCGREGVPLSLLVVDIDHFKRINDTYGHLGGDEVLRVLGGMLRQTVRASDVPCRYGGEEFVVVLPGMPVEEACARAGALRVSWEGTTVRQDTQSIRSTLSIGVASFPGDAREAEGLVKAADLALYAAKGSGRNRVIRFEPRMSHVSPVHAS